MDTMGAVLGPLLALALVQAHVPLRWIFAIAVVPGVASVFVILWLVKEHRAEPRPAAFRPKLPASPAFRWLLAGSVLFAAVYFGFALSGSGWTLAALFAFYGLYIAATEGTSKALIGRAIPTGERASALGFHYTAIGLAGFAASTIGGALWSAVGPWATFANGPTAALAAGTFMLAGQGRVRRALARAE